MENAKTSVIGNGILHYKVTASARGHSEIGALLKMFTGSE